VNNFSQIGSHDEDCDKARTNMNDSSDAPDVARLESELQLLREKIEQLQPQHCASPQSKPRRRISGIIAGAIFTVLLLAILGAQSKPDALYINDKGNVGINQTNPQAPLDVNGNAVVHGQMTVDGNTEFKGQVIGPLDVKDKALFRRQLTPSDTISAESGLVAGSSDLYFTDTKHNNSTLGNQTGFAAIENGQNYSALMILGRQTAKGRIVAMWDRVGINMGVCNPQTDACAPQAQLDVRGDVKVSGNINGERPPIMLNLGPTRPSNKWSRVEIDIGSYCQDNDGCRFKLMMQNVTNDDVKTIEEWIIIKNPSISNKNPGLSGYTRQSAGGEYGWTLNTSRMVTLFQPWDWCFADNYQSERAYAARSAAFAGTRIAITCHPDISARIFLYDR
jgi:hypothetical protein